AKSFGSPRVQKSWRLPLPVNPWTSIDSQPSSVSKDVRRRFKSLTPESGAICLLRLRDLNSQAFLLHEIVDDGFCRNTIALVGMIQQLGAGLGRITLRPQQG